MPTTYITGLRWQWSQWESYLAGELRDKQPIPAARAVKALSKDLTSLRLRDGVSRPFPCNPGPFRVTYGPQDRV